MTDKNLKTIEGQIISINHDKRGLAVKDREGNTHPMYWAENKQMVNYKGEPLKQWWFIKVTAERNEKDDTWWVQDHEFFKKPDDWPKPEKQDKKYYGKSPGERKDIRLMACLKALTELYVNTISFSDDSEIETDTFENAGIRIAKAAVEMEKILSGETK